MVNIQYINLALLLIIIIYLAWKLEKINIFSLQNWKIKAWVDQFLTSIFGFIKYLINLVSECLGFKNKTISKIKKCHLSNQDIADIISHSDNTVDTIDDENTMKNIIKQIKDDNLLAQNNNDDILAVGTAGSKYPPTSESYYQDFQLDEEYNDIQNAENKYTDMTRNDTKCMDDDLKIKKMDIFLNSPEMGIGKKINEIYDDLVDNKYSPNDLCSDEEKVVVNTEQVIDEFLYPPHQSKHLKINESV